MKTESVVGEVLLGLLELAILVGGGLVLLVPAIVLEAVVLLISIAGGAVAMVKARKTIGGA